MQDDMEDCPEFTGRVVKMVRFGKDDNGYSKLIVTFTDGSQLVALEEGQAGWFTMSETQEKETKL